MADIGGLAAGKQWRKNGKDDVCRKPVMIPARFAPILFGFILSGLMSCMVSGLSTFRALGLGTGFASAWAGNWLVSWAIAFPVVLVVAPITRRIVARLVK
jgi:hypothetical protein